MGWIRRGYVDVSGLQIHYREAGSGSRTVVCQAQCPGSSLQWSDAIEALADKGFRVLAPDMPGLGESEPFAFAPGVEDYGRVLAGFVREVAGGPVDAVGHHSGAAFVLSAATQSPELFRRTAYCGLPVYRAWEERQRIFAACQIDPYDSAGEFVSNRWRVIYGYVSGEIDRLANTRRALIERLQAGPQWYAPYVAIGNWDGGEDALRQLAQPSLMLEVEGDGLAAQAQWQAQAMPIGILRALEGGGIYPHINALPGLTAILDEFFAS